VLSIIWLYIEILYGSSNNRYQTISMWLLQVRKPIWGRARATAWRGKRGKKWRKNVEPSSTWSVRLWPTKGWTRYSRNRCARPSRGRERTVSRSRSASAANSRCRTRDSSKARGAKGNWPRPTHPPLPHRTIVEYASSTRVYLYKQRWLCYYILMVWVV